MPSIIRPWTLAQAAGVTVLLQFCDNVPSKLFKLVKGGVKPLYIQVHPRDNVAILVNPDGLPAGTEFAGGLTLRERIPQAHKVALRDLKADDPVERYGQIIGLTARPIAAGSWVHEDAVASPRPPALDQLPLATAVPAPEPELTGHAFDGFRNPDGSVGTGADGQSILTDHIAERWPDLIDVDAGRIATGVTTIEEVGWEIFRFILDVPVGRKQTWADHWGLHNAPALFNPGPIT